MPIFGDLLGRKSPQQVLQGHWPHGLHAAHYFCGLLPGNIFNFLLLLLFICILALLKCFECVCEACTHVTKTTYK